MNYNLIHLTDIHVARTASYRIDNIMETLSDKFKQVKSYIEEYDAKLVLISGDIFNSNIGSKIPHDIVADFAVMLKDLGVPIISIPGNHDMYLNKIDKHPLRTLYETGVMTEATNQAMLLDYFDTPIAIYGWNHKYDKDIKRFSEVNKVEAVYKIGLTHLVMGEEPGMFYSEPQYGIEEFKESPIHLFLNGHIHTPLGPLKNSKGQVFCQPGAFRRTNTASEEITRTPQITLIQLGNNPRSPSMKVKYLPLKCRDDIFMDWKREVDKESKNTINNFVEKASVIKTVEESDIFKMIDESDIDPEVKQILMGYLE